jgi:DHA1 family multidrug resistance protein B-like MFS transporter
MYASLHPNVRTRIAISFLSRIVGATIFPFMAIYFTRHLGAAAAGVLLMIQLGLQFLAGLYGGHLADTLGRRRLMVVGEAVKVAAFVLMLLANLGGPLPWLTFVGLLLVSVATGLINPAADAMLVDVSTPDTRAFMYAVSYWANNLSMMIGLIVGGWLYGAHFEVLLASLVVMSLVTLWLTVARISETYRPDPSRAAAAYGLGPLVASYGAVMRDRAFGLFTLAGIAVLTVEFQRNNYVAVRLAQDTVPRDLSVFGLVTLHLDGVKLLSLLTVGNTLMIVLFTALAARLIQGRSERRVMNLGFVLFGVGYGLLAFSNDLAVLFAGVLVLSVGELLYVPTRQSLLAGLIDHEGRGAYMAVSGLVFQVAKWLGALGIIVGTHVGGLAMGASYVLLALLGIVLSGMALGRASRDVRLASGD